MKKIVFVIASVMSTLFVGGGVSVSGAADSFSCYPAASFHSPTGETTVSSCGVVEVSGTHSWYGDLASLGVTPDRPMVEIVGTTSGYILLGEDGGVFAFGDAPFWGSVPGLGVDTEVVTIVVLGTSYNVYGRDGIVYQFSQPAPILDAATTAEAAAFVAAYPERLPAWEKLAWCETRNRNIANSTGTFRGYIQFSVTSWEAVGGTGDPMEWSWAEQVYRGELLLAIQGPGAWPGCHRAGLADLGSLPAL